MAASPQIDIVVPALASADELDRCLARLDSYLPPFMDKHWIIADDAGKDQVAEVATFFAKTRAHVTVFRNEKKLYLARTANRALGFTRGKFHIVCMTGVMLEDKALFDKLLYPFMRDSKAILTVADCRCDWNSFPPYRLDRTANMAPDLWAITKTGLELLGLLDTQLHDSQAFEDYQMQAALIANAWAIPSVRTMTAQFEWPKRLPTTEELDRRAISSPTILAQR
jgi:glycosyltransferase involved in cell wall biosynthesis